MIPNGERWYYLAVKKLPALLRGITSKQHCDFYCTNTFILLQQKTNVNLIKKYVKIQILQRCNSF